MFIQSNWIDMRELMVYGGILHKDNITLLWVFFFFLGGGHNM